MSNISDLYDIFDINKINDIIDSLIHDRTQADVDYALMLERESIHTDDDLRGAYNISDRSRVGGAVNYIAALMRLTTAGAVKSDWVQTDIVRAEHNASIIQCLKMLKQAMLYSGAETVEIPADLDKLSYQKANDIERILHDMYGVYMRMNAFFVGDGYASDFDAPDRQAFDDNWNFIYTVH